MHGVESEAAVCPGGYRMIGIRGSRFRRTRSAAGEGVGDSLGNISRVTTTVAGPQSFSGSVDRVFLIPAKLIPTDS